jgi:hypothetical protein
MFALEILIQIVFGNIKYRIPTFSNLEFFGLMKL